MFDPDDHSKLTVDAIQFKHQYSAGASDEAAKLLGEVRSVSP